MNTQWRQAYALSSAQRQLAEQRLEALANERDDLIDGWVDVAPHSAHHHQADETVTIRCRARRGTIVAHASHEELERALRIALDRLERQARRKRQPPSQLRKARAPLDGQRRSAVKAATGSPDRKSPAPTP